MSHPWTSVCIFFGISLRFMVPKPHWHCLFLSVQHVSWLLASFNLASAWIAIHRGFSFCLLARAPHLQNIPRSPATWPLIPRHGSSPVASAWSQLLLWAFNFGIYGLHLFPGFTANVSVTVLCDFREKKIEDIEVWYCAFCTEGTYLVI